MNTVAAVTLLSFCLVAVGMSLATVQTRRGRHAPASRMSLAEWGLADRGFGTVSAWMLLGGTIYTAYTFIAVPASIFASGTTGAFFAVPYTIIVYPLMFVFMPRLWSVAHRHGHITTADFVRSRYGSRALTMAVAATGILATLPYVALQLIGVRAVFQVTGLGDGEVALFLAFAVLAVLTYARGLRAPALVSWLKAALLATVIGATLLLITPRLGGFDEIFTAAESKLAQRPGGTLVPGSPGFWPYATLAFGSALALFVYPHTVTAVLAARSRRTVRRMAILLPAYTLVLAFFALLGIVAISAGTRPDGFDADLVIPQLFEDHFPSWLAGLAYSAIVISALVPVAIMSIAAANLFTRNICGELVPLNPDQQARIARITSLLVKFGALVLILFLDREYALDLQLFGGIWILQTVPAILCGLYTRWLRPQALLAGLLAGLLFGTLTAYDSQTSALIELPLPGGGPLCYIGLIALAFNLTVTLIFTLLSQAVGRFTAQDRTRPDDYHVDEVTAHA
jgi:SSS family solute:Na+ symporter